MMRQAGFTDVRVEQQKESSRDVRSRREAALLAQAPDLSR